MNTWREDLLNLLTAKDSSAETIFSEIERLSYRLGFDHVAYGFQLPYPLTQPRVFLLNNYPEEWRARYAKMGYLQTDPTVEHGRRSQQPVIWSDVTFANNPNLWADAKDYRITVGWAQSALEATGGGGLLTLSRSFEELSISELECKEPLMRWLVQVAHVALSHRLIERESAAAQKLTLREREVLKWTADGKSAQDIADILLLSKSAVDFHLKNITKKLDATNKTAAVARAVLLGCLK